MGEEFHMGVCSGGWWNPTRGGFDRPPPLSSAAAVCCSAAVGDVGSFRWTKEMLEIKARSGEESAASVSGSAVVFHGSPTAHASDSMAGEGFLMEPTVPVASSGLSSPTMDWSQVFIRSSRRAEGDFHALLHDQLSSRAYICQETSMGSDQVDHMGTANSRNPFKGFNQEFMADKPHLNPGDNSGGGGGESGAFHGDFRACSPTLQQGLLHQDLKPQNSYFNTSSTNFMSPEGFCLSSDESPRFPQFMKASPPRQQPASGHHQFSDDTHFWNAMGGTGDSAGSNFRSSTQMNDQVFTQQAFEEKPNLSTTARKNSDKSKDDDSPKHQDLKKRGLCLVPISFTFPVVNEPAVADFWTPNFGGIYLR